MTHAQLLRIYWAANPDLLVSGRLVKEEPVSAVSKRGLCWFFSSNGYLHRADTIKPHLKPLSSITDEDAIGVANLFNEAKTWQVEYRDENRAEVQTGKHKIVFWFESKKVLSQWKSDMLHEWLDIGYVPYTQITDYLRSKSYNLDFKEGEFIPI